MTFQDLNLIEPILGALKTEGYTIPTPVQARSIPLILERKDILGCAQTGTGKTAAFAIPIIQLLDADKANNRRNGNIRSLILTPTRELAIQIAESFKAYGKNTTLKYTVVYGGVGQNPQVETLRRGVDVLIATPGRLLDLINQGHIKLDKIEYFVLDEADRMLDMGFLPDVKRVINYLPGRRQSLFFSATMPEPIARLADSILVNPARVEVTPASSTVNAIEQVVYYVDKNNKRRLLADLLQDQEIERALVFTRTKHGADRVARDLNKAGVKAQAIHGDKSQNARQTALSNFKSGKSRVLVATDIAARGIDIDNLTHVVNFELPNIAESYVHRIGRTGRAGASGMAIAFCDASEKDYLKDIQKLIGRKVPEIKDHPYPLMIHDAEKPTQGGGRRNPGNGRDRNANGSSNQRFSENGPRRYKSKSSGKADASQQRSRTRNQA